MRIGYIDGADLSFSQKKVAVISGATRGIGGAIADELGEDGCFLILNARSEKELRKKQTELLKKGVRSIYIAGDIGDPKTAESLFKTAERLITKDGELSLINNAGISCVGLLQDLDDETWQELVSVNLGGVIYTSRAAIPLMLKLGGGHIINISSIWGSTGGSMEAAYSATKGGVIAFTKALAKELAPSNIAVNCVTPGVIDTSMNAVFTEEERQALREEIPAGRFGEPGEVARLCRYLASCDSYITGQIIGVNGGFS